MGRGRSREQGFVLVGLIVACFLILLALSVAAPTVAYQMRREREVETSMRAQQYVRAIRLYYRKFGHYPGSIEQLEQTNNIRFLRQRYIDPMTGKDDWRLIGVGQNKTTVKGFFGQPLAGLATTGAGASSLTPSTMGGSAGLGGSGATGAIGTGGWGGGGTGSSGPGYSSPGSSGPGFSSSGTTGAGANGTGNGNGSGTGSGTDPGTGLNASNMGPGLSGNGASGPFMGIGLVREGDSILDLNEQTTYNTWEFLYDPRSEAEAESGWRVVGEPGFDEPEQFERRDSGSGDDRWRHEWTWRDERRHDRRDGYGRDWIERARIWRNDDALI